MSTDTPNQVAKKATQSGALKRKSLTLIGIAGSTDALRALIMLPSGKVVTARMGERSSVGHVMGINETTVVLVRGGKEITLQMPN
ncbi:hypothetical protein FAP39_03570 [Shimia litoralis]|uniref:Pilus assembly protein PilP n=1 Tax=Shimia litoralis TaxID=420403 RepID=A0A4U7N722_9RHOB|nr:hypothetical protein [Shimia litoralis]TKZ21692.1 hypothetical protein FAP39_03570 [Shimia litoralis]